jgi:hypothetical protein
MPKESNKESKSAVVPADIAHDVDEIVSAIRAAAEQQGHSADDAVRILRPQGKGMLPGVAETLILVVGASTTWFGKKWLDTFVWPKIADLIKKPSDQAVDFVLSLVPIGAEAKGQHNEGQS